MQPTEDKRVAVFKLLFSKFVQNFHKPKSSEHCMADVSSARNSIIRAMTGGGEGVLFNFLLSLDINPYIK